MRKVLVALPSGAGVVRTEHGLLVTGEIRDGSGAYLRDKDPFSPASAWLDENRSVVGGLLPPDAVGAEVVGARGTRMEATVGGGAYVAVLEEPSVGLDPVVCCRGANGDPVRRPWADDYPSVRVTDAEEPCPACGALDWDEYTPFEEWRGGRGSEVDGTHVPNPVVSCRVCGHEEREGTFYGIPSVAADSEDEATRTARIARARGEFRKRRWLSGQLTLRAVTFPIYAAEGWPAQLGGGGSHNDELTSITVRHYEEPGADPFGGDRPRLIVTTHRTVPGHERGLYGARAELRNWIGQTAEPASWPDASRAARTLWLRARSRATRAAVLEATQGEVILTIDELPVEALLLESPRERWVAVASHADLVISVAARALDPLSLKLEPIADPVAQLLGPELPDA